MKDIVIRPRQIRTELLLYAGCLVAAYGVDVFAILRFHTQWKELLTTAPITLALSGVLFAALAVLRICRFLLRRIFTGKRA
jgi:hypothetical protein